MKIKNLFSRRATSLLLVFLLAFTMLPTGALAAEVIDENHVHTEECSHVESIETLDAIEDETIVSEPTPETYEIASDTEVSEVTEEPEESKAPIDVQSVALDWYITSYGTLHISGSGTVDQFSSPDDQPWKDKRSEIKVVLIDSTSPFFTSSLNYWFSNCSSLVYVEIPSQIETIGENALDGCISIEVVKHGNEYVIGKDIIDSILTSVPDNGVAFFAARSGCGVNNCICSGSCSSTYGNYRTMENPDSYHVMTVYCAGCGKTDGIIVTGSHSYNSSGTCSLCGYYNSSYDNSVCYHYSSYYSWSGCTYYEYCSNCGEYLGSGVSHGSTYTEWSGCNWYEYCRDCDQLMDSGTSHGTYSYGSWQYYSSTRHRRSATCNDCGETTYSYGNHSKTTKYTNYSDTQHQYGSYCSTCSSYVGSTTKQNHSYSYGSWSNYTSTQHRRTKSCTKCDYSTYEYASHSLSYGAWTSHSATQHKRTVSCSCGYSTTEYANHSLTYGNWTVSEGDYYSSKHERKVSCSCGYSTTEYEAHNLYGVSDYKYYNEQFHMREEECACGYPRDAYSYHTFTTTMESLSGSQHKVIKTCSLCGHQVVTIEDHTLSYGGWDIASDEQHHREASCPCGYCGEEYDYHSDNDGDGYCDTCSHLMTFFSVTVPANMSMTIANNGYVYSASNVAVINNSSHAVEITSVTVTAGNGWTIVPYDYNMANEKVDSKLIGFYLNNAVTTKIGSSEKLSLPTNWTIDRGDTFPLIYDATVSATSDVLSNEQVLTLVFVINWAPR